MDAMIITPDPGSEKFVAQVLLSLADSPFDVQTVTNPNIAFRVPMDLYERFVEATNSDTDAEPAKSEVKPKKAAGRPKKKEEGQ